MEIIKKKSEEIYYICHGRGETVCVGILFVRLVAFYLAVKLLLGREIARKCCKLPVQPDPAQSGFPFLCYYTHLLTLSVGFQMVTIYLVPDPTSSATLDQLRDESERIGMRNTAADLLVHTELNLSNILAFIERQTELFRRYSNKKKMHLCNDEIFARVQCTLFKLTSS